MAAMEWRHAACRVGLVLALALSGESAYAWMINEDYEQLDARGANGFEILIEGDVAASITGGGESSVTNPFASPTRSTFPQPGFPSNTVVRLSGAGTIPAAPGTKRHVGIFGTGAKPTVLAKAWTFASGTPPKVPVPKSNFDFVYDPVSGTLQFIVENTSPDTVTFSDVGYLLSSFERPIEDLSRAVLPPSAFNPLPGLDHEYLPGESDSELINFVASGMFALSYGSVAFSGASLGNDFTGVGGEWAQVAVADEVPVPSPASLPLLAAGLTALALRRRAGIVAAMIAAIALAAPDPVRADVFVVPLATPPTAGDPRPFIDVKVTKPDGTTTTVKTLIDTGSTSSEFKVTAGVATAMGLDTSTGTASTERGINGASAATTGVTYPAGTSLGLSPAPTTPAGQPASQPALPGKATVGSLPAGREGTIGNGFLKDNFDAAAQLDGYFYFVAKGQGAAGVARAVAISSFLAFATPAVVGPDGRPAGTRSAPVTPTPPKPPTPGEETVDGGYDMSVDIETPGGAVLDNVLFTIRSGFERSLISRSLAALLGIDLSSLPSAVDAGNFGALPVLLTQLTLRLFDDPSFPSFTLDVGIVQNPSDDPFGETILGDDLLSQLPYWEIFYGTGGPDAIFYAAAAIDTVSAPGSAWLFAGALPLLARGRRRR